MSLRSLVAVLPIALAVAALAHGVRFGDEHEFGEGYHDWLCTLLLTGLPAVAWAFIARALAGITTYGDGTVLVERLASLLPGKAAPRVFAPILAAFASAIYTGVERLEADGDTSYVFALTVIVAISFCFAVGIRRALDFVALATLAIFRSLITAVADRALPLLRATRPCLKPRAEWATVRLGRAPPIPA